MNIEVCMFPVREGLGRNHCFHQVLNNNSLDVLGWIIKLNGKKFELNEMDVKEKGRGRKRKHYVKMILIFLPNAIFLYH